MALREKGMCAVVASKESQAVSRVASIGLAKGTTSRFDLPHAKLLGFTQEGRILAASDGFDSVRNRSLYRNFCFFDFSVDGTAPVLHEYVIQLPKAEEIRDYYLMKPGGGEEVQLSRRGDRLAWIVH